MRSTASQCAAFTATTRSAPTQARQVRRSPVRLVHSGHRPVAAAPRFGDGPRHTDAVVAWPRRARPAGELAALLAAGAISWWASRLTPFTTPAAVATGVPAATVAVVTLRRGPRARSRGRPAPAARDAVLWLSLLVVATALELVELAGRPRRAHPTVSSIADGLLAHHSLKALAFLVWLALGWAQARW